MEIHALAARGRSLSAIARHIGRDRRTVRAYLHGDRTPGVRARSVPDPLGVGGRDRGHGVLVNATYLKADWAVPFNATFICSHPSRPICRASARPNPDLHVSAAVHQAFVKVAEKGTEAAAATAIGDSGTQGPHPAFAVGWPFLWFIRDRETGAVLFLGRMSDPRDTAR